MSSVDEVLNEALRNLALPSANLKELPQPEAKRIFDAARATFVNGNPRTWWLDLKHTPRRVEVSASLEFSFLREQWPAKENKCYFVPENESDVPRVFDATLGAVIQILGDCSYFEYYLVGKNLDWLMIETDHNELLIVQSDPSLTSTL